MAAALKMHQAYPKNPQDILDLFIKVLPFTKNNLPFTQNILLYPLLKTYYHLLKPYYQIVTKIYQAFKNRIVIQRNLAE